MSKTTKGIVLVRSQVFKQKDQMQKKLKMTFDEEQGEEFELKVSARSGKVEFDIWLEIKRFQMDALFSSKH